MKTRHFTLRIETEPQRKSWKIRTKDIRDALVKELPFARVVVKERK